MRNDICDHKRNESLCCWPGTAVVTTETCPPINPYEDIGKNNECLENGKIIGTTDLHAQTSKKGPSQKRSTMQFDWTSRCDIGLSDIELNLNLNQKKE